MSSDKCLQALQGFVIKDEREHSERDKEAQVPLWKSREPVC